jgi:hypothetical protein
VSFHCVRVNHAWVAEETTVLLLGTDLRFSREEKNDSWERENLARAAGPTAVLYSYETPAFATVRRDRNDRFPHQVTVQPLSSHGSQQRRINYLPFPPFS